MRTSAARLVDRRAWWPAWPGLATSYFVAMVMTIRESPVVAVAELVIRLTPGAVAERAIRVLGHHDKPFLVLVLLRDPRRCCSRGPAGWRGAPGGRRRSVFARRWPGSAAIAVQCSTARQRIDVLPIARRVRDLAGLPVAAHRAAAARRAARGAGGPAARADAGRPGAAGRATYPARLPARRRR